MKKSACSNILYVVCQLMKHSFYVFLITILSSQILCAAAVNGQSLKEVKRTFEFKNNSLKDALRTIEKQTNFKFIYDDDLIKSYQINESFTNRSLDYILAKILEQTKLDFKQQDYKILLIKKAPPVVIKPIRVKQVKVITGVVTDKSNGQTLPGVTIKVKGKSNGVVTGLSGEYKISVEDETASLVFSYIGYHTIELPVGTNTTLNVALEVDLESLQEVVVVGYGTQKKVNLTGAIASVGSDKLESRPIVNLGDGLNGLVPNLNVNINNGQPGTGASYNVRGYTTIGSNSAASPLVLVDGVQRDPNLIDPNDVENVTVLKDAAASAIYGSRAAFGVILITTKSGTKGGTKVNYSGSYTTSKPTKLPAYLNSQDYIKMFNTAQRTGAVSGGYTSNDPFTEQDSTLAAAYFRDPINNPSVYVDPGNPNRYRYVGNTDWIKILYPGWAPQQQHHLSIAGGEGKTTYAASLGYFTQDGLEKLAKQVYKRYVPSLKVNSDITPWLTFNLNMSVTRTDNNQSAYTSQGSQGGAWIPTDLRPLMPVYHPDGNFSGQGNYTNPVAVIQQNGRDIESKNDLWTTGKVIIKPVDHVTIVSDYTWNNYTSFDKSHRIPFNEYGVNGAFLNIFPHTNPSQVAEDRQNNNYNAFNAYATYENTFNTKHYFKALIGYNQENKHYELSNSLARNLIDPTFPAIGTNNDSKPTVSGIETEWAVIGSFFRLNYVFDKRYLIEVNGRYDGTSRFPAADRYAFSPSASIGWNIVEESFMQGIKNTVNELKLRASYGQLPNQQTPNAISSGAQYPYIPIQNAGTVGYLFNNQLGVTVGSPGLISNSLTWEKVQTKNIGLDFGLLNNKLTGSFDYFITDTKDMLVAGEQLPALLGTGAPLKNSADLRTKGWELSIGWKDRAINDELFYAVTLGLSDAASKITKYDLNPSGSLATDTYRVGQKLGDIWGFVTEGFYKTDTEAASVDNSDLAGYKWLAGDIKYADLNNDGKINDGNNTLSDPGDQKIIGNKTPRYKFGLNLNMGYKNFDFAAFFQGVLKADFSPYDYAFYAFRGNEWNIPYQNAVDYWTPENPNTYFSRPRFNGSGNQKTQTKYLQNAAYGRVKQLTLGYSLPKQLINKLKIQKVRAYVTGANLFTITSLFDAYDPEIATGVGIGASPLEIYPINKSVSFGLQITL